MSLWEGFAGGPITIPAGKLANAVRTILSLTFTGFIILFVVWYLRRYFSTVTGEWFLGLSRSLQNRPPNCHCDAVFARTLVIPIGRTRTLDGQPIHDTNQVLVILGIGVTFVSNRHASGRDRKFEGFVLCALCDSTRKL